MTQLLSASVATAALGCGLIAGVYFTFSTFVMKALAGLPRAQGIAAMQSINEVILASPFIPLFFGTTLLCLALAGYGAFHLGAPASWALVGGGLAYFVGMFVVTAVFNVPLNEALRAIDPVEKDAGQVWQEYLSMWTFWNHVRTVSSTAACGVFVAALVWW